MAFYATRGIQFTTLKFKSYSNNLKEEKKGKWKISELVKSDYTEHKNTDK